MKFRQEWAVRKVTASYKGVWVTAQLIDNKQSMVWGHIESLIFLSKPGNNQKVWWWHIHFLPLKQPFQMMLQWICCTHRKLVWINQRTAVVLPKHTRHITAGAGNRTADWQASALPPEPQSPHDLMMTYIWSKTLQHRIHPLGSQIETIHHLPMSPGFSDRLVVNSLPVLFVSFTVVQVVSHDVVFFLGLLPLQQHRSVRVSDGHDGVRWSWHGWNIKNHQQKGHYQKKLERK